MSRDMLSLPEDNFGIIWFGSETFLPSIFANSSVALQILGNLWLTATPKGTRALSFASMYIFLFKSTALMQGEVIVTCNYTERGRIWVKEILC